MIDLDPTLILLAAFACALGGILKGATGAGAPIIAVPVLAASVNIQFAVAVYVIPNLITNVWQIWQYRRELTNRKFLALFAGAGAVGGVLGSYLLVGLPSPVLMTSMAVVVLTYVVFRLIKQDWSLNGRQAMVLAAPAGLLGGILQGATGISAPASLTFLNAVRLPRAEFIATISLFFACLSTAQVERLTSLGIFDLERLVYGLMATVVSLMFMPVGDWLAKRLSRELFDKLILLLLVALAVKTLIDVII